MRIFLTGGSGFIGSRLAPLAVQAGHAVTVVTAVNNAAEQARCEALSRAGIQLVRAPLEDAAALTRHLQNHDVVIHLAAAQHEAGKPESYFQQVNVEGTARLLELAAAAGIRRFVHGSTIGVYGSAASGRLDESSPLAPDNPYGRTKAAAEERVRAQSGPMQWCIIRISETYGPADMRLLKLFRGVRSGRFAIVGDGKNLHQLIYVDDLARGLLAACTAEAAVGETVVLAGAEQITTSEMVAAIGAAVGRQKPVRHAPLWPFMAAAMVFEATFRPLGLNPPLHRRRLDFFRKSFYFATDKAQRLLGFTPRVNFADGARLTAEWYAQQGML